MVSTVINKFIMGPIVALIVRQERMEGDFRYRLLRADARNTHTHTHTHTHTYTYVHVYITMQCSCLVACILLQRISMPVILIG